MSQFSPVTIRKVEGTSRNVYGRTLTPIAQVIAVVRHEGTIRAGDFEGAGWGVAWSMPREIVEDRDGETYVLPIPDATGAMLRQMTIVAVAVPLLATALLFFNRWMRGR